MSQIAIPEPSDPQANIKLFTYFCEECRKIGLVIPDGLRISFSIHLQGYSDLPFMILPHDVDTVLLEQIPDYVYSLRIRSSRERNTVDSPSSERKKYDVFIFTKNGNVHTRRSEDDVVSVVFDNWEAGCREIIQLLALTMIALRQTVNQAIEQAAQLIISNQKG